MSHRDPARQAARLASAPPVAPAVPERAALALAPDLLARVAQALNDLEASGVPVRLAHDAVLSDAGYVLRLVLPHELNMAGESWQVRTRMLTEFPPPAGDECDET